MLSKQILILNIKQMKQNKEYKLNMQIYEQIKNTSFANSEEKIIESIEVIKRILNNKTINKWI